MSVASEAVADEVGALRVSTGLTCACVAVVGLVLLADSHGLVGHWVSAASVAGAVDLYLKKTNKKTENQDFGMFQCTYV